MQVEYYNLWSVHLNQQMEFKVYGNRGKPVIVFPSQGGRFYEYEDFGMVGACQPYIADGKIQLITVDSIDNQSWVNWGIHPADRAIRHNQYDRYIIEELIPFVRQQNPYPGKLISTGCSMGAYHSAHFFFRHPEVFDTMIAISGLFRLNMFIGDTMDDNIYFNSPLAYLPNLTDPDLLDLFRQSDIIVCVGQGAWEDPMLEDAYALKRILEDKQIPAWIDIWGYDVNHDWPWWRRMMPYFLSNLEFETETTEGL
jgi:esterase/lipase superfamily enzyme